ncbi:hypothetical protein ABBQ32_009881 [Trebouxia sp. C0010 RCD-2024]
MPLRKIEVQCNPFCRPDNWPECSPWPVISDGPTTSVLEQLESIGIQYPVSCIQYPLLDGTHKLLSSFAAVSSQEIVCFIRPVVFFLGTVAPASALRSSYTDTLSENMLQSRSTFLLRSNPPLLSC